MKKNKINDGDHTVGMLFPMINGYSTGPVNSADSTEFTGPDKTHSLVLKHATLFVFLYSFSSIN